MIGIEPTAFHHYIIKLSTFIRFVIGNHYVSISRDTTIVQGVVFWRTNNQWWWVLYQLSYTQGGKWHYPSGRVFHIVAPRYLAILIFGWTLTPDQIILDELIRIWYILKRFKASCLFYTNWIDHFPIGVYFIILSCQINYNPNIAIISLPP